MEQKFGSEWWDWSIGIILDPVCTYINLECGLFMHKKKEILQIHTWEYGLLD